MNRIKKLTTLATLAITLASAPLFALEPPKTDEEKTLYTIGLIVARQMGVFNLSTDELARVKQGLDDGIAGVKPAVEIADFNGKVQDLAKARRKALGDKQAVAGQAFLEKAAKEKGAVKTASGMVYVLLAEGKGESPKAADVVKVNYRGTPIDGKEFDSSYKRGKPLEFKLDNVIKCWTEGVQNMKPGGKARLVCPPQLAYGDNGAGEMILPGATLDFEVELLEVKPAAAAKPDITVPAKPAAPVKIESDKK